MTISRQINKQRVKPFEQYPDQYDAWFDGEKGQYIFSLEVDCLRRLLSDTSKPRLEVGVGTGRFAAALDIDYGLDPSQEVLAYAEKRNIIVKQGFGEELPYKNNSFATVIMVVTVCFLTDPQKAFKEVARVLKPHGSFTVGLVPRDSAWGKMYAEKGRNGHAFYAPAVFYSCSEVVDLAEAAGFTMKRACSCLFEEPDSDLTNLQSPKMNIGAEEKAGFVAMRFELE
ncbi:MAG: class I SAM-dependent methyltransferase [Verrucomicrobiota bacterium]